MKRILTFSFLALMLACLLAFAVSAETLSGTCGTDVTWTFDTESGVLTVDGSGQMDDFSSTQGTQPWYAYKDSIQTVAIGNGVTSIGKDAFSDCSSLSSVLIPDSVTSISDKAFYCCSKLSSVTIGNGVTRIGNNVFLGCTNLSRVAIGNGVTSIGSSAFGACSKLSIVDIRDLSAWCGIQFANGSSNPLSNGGVMYLNGEKVTDLQIPDDITSIRNYAFSSCSSLSNVTIPDSVKNIGIYAFSGCSSLSSVIIPDSVTKIGGHTFSGCSSLSSVAIPDSVTSIGNYTFSDCSSLSSVSIPDSVKSIGNNAFYNCSSLSSVTIPDSVTSIGDDAFYNCSSLSSVTIPGSVTRIGLDAFFCCRNLSVVDIRDLSAWCGIQFANGSSNPLSNGGVLYLNGEKVTAVQFPENITSIPGYTFYSYSSLTSVTIPDSVTSIGKYAFYGCQNLSSITMGNAVTSIAECVFYGCRNLNSVTLSDGVTSIGYEVFYGCKSLNSITIPDSVTSIGSKAFYGCSSLAGVTIPDSVTTIGEEAFYNCSSLNSVTIPDSVRAIGTHAFLSCNKLNNVFITDLAAWCNIDFRAGSSNPLNYAHNLYLNGSLVTQLFLPDGIGTVKSYAFSNATCLTSVVLPKSVTVISQGAFVGCTNIKDVYYEGTAEEWESVRIGTNNGSLDTAAIHLNEASVFTVKYHAGTDDTVTGMPTAGSAYGTYTLPETVPVRVGYRFCGWALAADSSAADYQPGVRLDIYQDTDFYAVWAPGAKYALGAITLIDGSYNVIDAIPDVSFIAEVQLTNLSAAEAGKILLVTYDADGRMLELHYLYADTAVGQNGTFDANISNPDGKVAKVKALVIADFQSFQPLAEPVEVTKA